MRSSSISASARSRLAWDHFPFGRRGVKRISQWLASNLSSCPSIQPWQRAPSIASCFETLGMADPALANFSHTPFDVVGWVSSQRSHSALDAKASTGRPVLIFGDAILSIIIAVRRETHRGYFHSAPQSGQRGRHRDLGYDRSEIALRGPGLRCADLHPE